MQVTVHHSSYSRIVQKHFAEQPVPLERTSPQGSSYDRQEHHVMPPFSNAIKTCSSTSVPAPESIPASAPPTVNQSTLATFLNTRHPESFPTHQAKCSSLRPSLLWLPPWAPPQTLSSASPTSLPPAFLTAPSARKYHLLDLTFFFLFGSMPNLYSLHIATTSPSTSRVRARPAPPVWLAPRCWSATAPSPLSPMAPAPSPAVPSRSRSLLREACS